MGYPVYFFHFCILRQILDICGVLMAYTYLYPFLRYLLQNIFNVHISGKVFFLVFVFCHVRQSLL